jgi:hypothetical protein
VFAANSRYANAGIYQVSLPDGSVVTATRIPAPSAPKPIGWYRRAEDERLDVIAYRFVKDATQAWLLCNTNDAMSPDALASHDLIGIPPQGAGR